MDLNEIIKSIETKGNLDLSVFKEPRGVSRVLQLVIGTLAGLAIYGYEGIETVKLCAQTVWLTYSYPFELTRVQESVMCNKTPITLQLASDDSFSQYSEYFLFVCILSTLYCTISIIIYTKCTSTYETNDKYPLGDFIGTVVIAVLWLFASAAWTHGLSGLKLVTNPSFVQSYLVQTYRINIKVSNNGYFGLNVSAILGCLSFFIWASDLWFLYKETVWFQGRHGEAVGSPA
ncbi:synaptophysin-like [Lycorma delicatula]|uniref:synaptophysin-like n=1 Tax=Lycorma delicatula TaxID=130591 RepID=UPI003F511C77